MTTPDNAATITINEKFAISYTGTQKRKTGAKKINSEIMERDTKRMTKIDADNARYILFENTMRNASLCTSFHITSC